MHLSDGLKAVNRGVQGSMAVWVLCMSDLCGEEEDKACRCDLEAEEEAGHVHDVVHLCEVYLGGLAEEEDALYHCMALFYEMAVVDGVRGSCRAEDGCRTYRGTRRGVMKGHDHALVAAHHVSSPLHHAAYRLQCSLYHLMTNALAALFPRQMEVLLALLAVAQR